MKIRLLAYDPNFTYPNPLPKRRKFLQEFLRFFINWIWDFNEQLTLNAGIRLTFTGLNASWKEWNNIDAFLFFSNK